MFSPLTQELVRALRCLPGIGPKSAQRMAYHLLHESNKSQGKNLAHALDTALERVTHCQRCRLYTEETLCEICSNPKRRQDILCIVETPADVSAIEQSSSFFGLYFVLHGHLSPIDGIGPDEVGIPQLLQTLNNPADEQSTVREIIIATNSTMEGEATAHFIASQIQPNRIKCSRIAHGVPIGGELEFLDSSTLSHAFQSRTALETDNV